MKYYCKVKPGMVVEFIDEAELRIAEIKRLAVIYRRNGRLYVRPKAEFLCKFVVIPEK
jgi:hypothetical protein